MEFKVAGLKLIVYVQFQSRNRRFEHWHYGGLMATVMTTRVRAEWVADLRARYGTDQRIAEEMHVDKSTAGRWLSGASEASPRFIGTALLTWPITFDDAFVAVEEEAERRRARVYRHATGRPVGKSAVA